MKTKCIFMLSLLLIIVPPVQLMAQTPVYSGGSVSFTGGYGLGVMWALTQACNINTENLSVPSYAHIRTTGPIFLKFEVGLSRRISLGVNYSCATFKWTAPVHSRDSLGSEKTFIHRYCRSTSSVLLRMNVHIGPFKKWDPYVGTGLGYRNALVYYSTDNPVDRNGIQDRHDFHLGWELSAGCRYYIIPNLGIYAEAGFTKALFQAGMVVNIPNKHRGQERKNYRKKLNTERAGTGRSPRFSPGFHSFPRLPLPERKRDRQ